MTKLGLTLNEAKTSVKNARQESFDFLGYTFGPRTFQANGTMVSGRKPVQEECAAGQDEGRRAAGAGQQGSWPEVRDTTEQILRGWSAYFGYGSRGTAYRAVDQSRLRSRAQASSRRRHKVQGAASDGSPCDVIYRELWRAVPRTRAQSGRRRVPCGEASRKAGCRKSARPVVCPAKAGMFSRRQTCRGRSQSPVVWIAEVMETETLKPIDEVFRGKATSHRAVIKVNALWPRK